MKNYLAGFLTAYAAGAVACTVATWNAPEMDRHHVTLERVGLGIALAAIWPWHAYLAINEWDS
ncbi:hypothetical protein CH276_22590 [Rhodococcus sp. 06-470-2]|jgi:hypothetical protein|uniref:hypothetical protein n=1 Tax=unclassified Rhodococcus (in: high G+C Gram-positive bacteria) TaxID=192944 RepID=UPI000B9AD916|nr:MULTISPECIES: hypothetical protein [unclassified Rhodococcus (in: high G+C Gram-positive bacteria)]OZC59239.1 hypothetical protein CH276_22590 [Rhodococcus sp. 06-470-2]OZE66826.1 hypothetical protein CH265_07915 [Rhodococcus sp. 05-2221-1B]